MKNLLNNTTIETINAEVISSNAYAMWLVKKERFNSSVFGKSTHTKAVVILTVQGVCANVTMMF